jgi:site-specific recombinase XerD
MKDELKLRGYSVKTRKSYLNHIKRFESHISGNLEEVTVQNARDYIIFLLDTGRVSHSFANQAISSIKFLFENIMKKQITEFLPRPKRENKLPNVLSQRKSLKYCRHWIMKNIKHFYF